MSESVANAVFLQSKAGKGEELAVRLEELRSSVPFRQRSIDL